MSWPLAVAGTVHRDDIITPRGRAESLGGSAVYFALAASHERGTHVLLNGVVGGDCYDAVSLLFDGCDADLSGLARSDLPTFVWHAEHDFERWVTASESYEEGCERGWEPHITEMSARAPMFFLASMRPQWQLALLERSRARLIGVDTMTLYTTSERDSVHHVIERADVAFLNHAELRSLTEIDDWREAARSLISGGRVRAVVVKRGPAGAALVTREGIVVESAAHQPEQVVDPTGAGDALAGGFLAHCAREESDDEATFASALDAGLECAAQAISTFGPEGLRRYAAP